MPVGIYPPWLRIALTALVPVAFAVTVPVQALIGRLDAGTFLVTLLITPAALLASRWLWRYGLRHDTDASA